MRECDEVGYAWERRFVDVEGGRGKRGARERRGWSEVRKGEREQEDD
jgi:hypothetical protein